MRWLVALAGLTATAGDPAVPPPPTWSAVLDCKRTVYAIDPLVCGDPKLLAGARRVGQAYAEALRRASERDAEALTAGQEAWSKQRNRCAFERRADRCIDRVQAMRVRDLKRQGD